jgi:isoleucyl-tRNA synthetase
MMAPILVFTAEEIWQHMPKDKGSAAVSSVHLLEWPEPDDRISRDDLALRLGEVISRLPLAAKSLEELRGKGDIGSSFDAQINILTNDPNRYTFLQSLKYELCEIFKVSRVEISQDNGSKVDIQFEVSKARGEKCVRCWNYSLQVGKDKEHPLLCENCLKAIKGKIK